VLRLPARLRSYTNLPFAVSPDGFCWRPGLLSSYLCVCVCEAWRPSHTEQSIRHKGANGANLKPLRTGPRNAEPCSQTLPLHSLEVRALLEWAAETRGSLGTGNWLQAGAVDVWPGLPEHMAGSGAGRPRETACCSCTGCRCCLAGSFRPDLAPACWAGRAPSCSIPEPFFGFRFSPPLPRMAPIPPSRGASSI